MQVVILFIFAVICRLKLVKATGKAATTSLLSQEADMNDAMPDMDLDKLLAMFKQLQATMGKSDEHENEEGEDFGPESSDLSNDKKHEKMTTELVIDDELRDEL